MNLHRGFSDNGIDWKLDNDPSVLTSCNGFVYSFGAALLDLDQPWKVIYRGSPYLLSPQTTYECVGDVPNVAFPCATLYDKPQGESLFTTVEQIQ